jgi:hypothetical protein
LNGLVQVIDTLGGVDVTVQHPILDEMYPDDLNSEDPYAFFRPVYSGRPATSRWRAARSRVVFATEPEDNAPPESSCSGWEKPRWV